MAEPARDWRCRIGWHSYARRRNDPSVRTGAAHYLQGRRCQKVLPVTEGSNNLYPIGDVDQSGGGI